MQSLIWCTRSRCQRTYLFLSFPNADTELGRLKKTLVANIITKNFTTLLTCAYIVDVSLSETS